MVAPLSRKRILFLSQVHPDFLAPIYSMSNVLEESGWNVDVFSYASPAAAAEDLGNGIRIHVGGISGGGVFARMRVRRNYRRQVEMWVRQHPPDAIISVCPFSFLEALRVSKGKIPVIFHAFETYDYPVGRRFFNSPASNLRNFRALRRLGKAVLVSTPSSERSGWLAGRAKLQRIPTTVINAPDDSLYRTIESRRKETLDRLLPQRFIGRPITINTGNVSPTQAIRELIESVVHWPREACLVVTNVREDSYAREIRDLTDDSPRREDIFLLPLLPRREMLALQSSSSIGVCLLREQDALETKMPAPNKVGEYLHGGLLVLGTRMRYLDQLEQQGVAVLSNSLEPSDIGRAMTQAVARLANPKLREEIFDFARSHYCMKEQIRPILQVLNRVANENVV